MIDIINVQEMKLLNKMQLSVCKAFKDRKEIKIYDNVKEIRKREKWMNTAIKSN